MRSYTESDLPGRCRRCWVRQEFCLCQDFAPVPTRTEVLIVRHLREALKSTGTARIAGLALPHSRLIEYADKPEPVTEALGSLEGACLLFPTDTPAPWPELPPGKLVVIDGTWRQTRRMYQRLPALHALPRLALPTRPARVLRLRETTFEEGRSTLEAIAEALRLLEGDAVAAPLHALHALYVERVLRARGIWEQRLQEFNAEPPAPFIWEG
jgi:DTW domain-containing protein YfiP